MADFISRETAYKMLTEYYHHSSGVQHTVLREALNRVPTADVRPVAEGHWLTWEEMFPDQNPRRKNNLGVFCSACKKHADNITDFCPNCGADMRPERRADNGRL